MQTGVIAASNVNLWAKRKVKPDRFIPRVRARRDPRQVEAEMHQWARMHNRIVERKQRESEARGKPNSTKPTKGVQQTSR